MATPRTKHERDSSYLLKVVLFALLGTIWIQVNGRTLIPVGLVLGLVYASHDRFQIDRKIEYALLVVASLIGLAGAGLYIGITY